MDYDGSEAHSSSFSCRCSCEGAEKGRQIFILSGLVIADQGQNKRRVVFESQLQLLIIDLPPSFPTLLFQSASFYATLPTYLFLSSSHSLCRTRDPITGHKMVSYRVIKRILSWQQLWRVCGQSIIWTFVARPDGHKLKMFGYCFSIGYTRYRWVSDTYIHIKYQRPIQFFRV